MDSQALTCKSRKYSQLSVFLIAGLISVATNQENSRERPPSDTEPKWQHEMSASEIANSCKNKDLMNREYIADKFSLRESRPEDFVDRMTRESAVILIGTVTEKIPRLTRDCSIFTDYFLTLEELLKDDSARSIRDRKTIVVEHLGGTFKHGEDTFSLHLTHFEQFSVGRRYLLFLDYSEDNQKYEAKPEGSFELEGNKYYKLTVWRLWSLSYPVSDPSTFLNMVRTSIERGHPRQ